MSVVEDSPHQHVRKVILAIAAVFWALLLYYVTRPTIGFLC